jgi:hypothetical protein
MVMGKGDVNNCCLFCFLQIMECIVFYFSTMFIMYVVLHLSEFCVVWCGCDYGCAIFCVVTLTSGSRLSVKCKGP